MTDDEKKRERKNATVCLKILENVSDYTVALENLNNRMMLLIEQSFSQSGGGGSGLIKSSLRNAGSG
jgi:hypothetical protein